MLQLQQLLARNSTSHIDFTRKRSLAPALPDTDIVRKVHSLRATALADGIVIDVTTQGVFDNNTDKLVGKTTKLLHDCDWFLMGMCDCDSPFYDFFAKYVLNMGR